MPLRNLFGRRTATANAHDENTPPDANTSSPGFERVDTVGSKASSALSIRSGSSIDTGSYKLSVVNDSGVYLPPSPTEEASERGLWPRKYLNSRTSSDGQSMTGEIEHFPISRESFDSYRRSFDISAKSPVVSGIDRPTRQSLDSARFSRLPARSRLPPGFGPTKLPTPPLDGTTGAADDDEDFEDVGLDGENPTATGRSSRRKFFSMFDSQDTDLHTSVSPTPPLQNGVSSSSGVARFLPGRKRAPSGTGAELKPIGPPSVTMQGVEA